ncbi:hypothetical protein OROGR_011971 [Orobanche gracilis]
MVKIAVPTLACLRPSTICTPQGRFICQEVNVLTHTSVFMALPLGKLTLLVGAATHLGLVGTVLAKEGRVSNVSDFFSGAFKIVFKQLRKDDSAASSPKPRNDSLVQERGIGFTFGGSIFANIRISTYKYFHQFLFRDQICCAQRNLQYEVRADYFACACQQKIDSYNGTSFYNFTALYIIL